MLLGIALSGIIGLAGLGTEVSSWYMTKRTMQGAADAGAYTAATAKSAGEVSTNYTLAARSIAAGYGFANGTGGTSVTVNSPPASGSYTSNSNAVEVIVAQPQKALISAMFLPSGPTIQARSVALVNTSGSGCVVALDRGNVTDISDSGGTILNLNNCSLYVNAPDSNALSMSGSATINALSAYISGGVSTSGSARLNTTSGTYTGVNPISDPYGSVAIPSYSGCDQNNFSLSGGASKTISPTGSGSYVFCNGLSLSGGATLTLNPGVYIIDRGSFSISGGATLNGSGVSIVLTSSTGSNYATASISGGSTVTLSAPSSGATAGLALFQDRNAPSTGSNSISGGATQNITGAIYFPSQNVSFSGGSSSGSAQCTQLIGYTLTFSGGATFNNNCASAGTRAIGSSAAAMVE